MTKFTDKYNNIVADTAISHIKHQLLSYFNKSTWEEYVNSLEFGQCQKISKIVYFSCPSLVTVYSVEEHFSKEAIKQLNALGDNGEMTGVHYIVKINDKFYDFGKGANTINSIYLIGSNEEKYLVELSENELSHFDNLNCKNPEFWDHIKINKRKIKSLAI
jgi:hypothetical protein